MNLVDSSGWLEYFADGPNADYFTEVLSNPEELIVPTISLFEVFKVILRTRNENDAIQAIALMKQGIVVELTSGIAIQSARISYDKKLPMADSIILATAQYYDAIIWTMDEHFENLERVKYFQKK